MSLQLVSIFLIGYVRKIVLYHCSSNASRSILEFFKSVLYSLVNIHNGTLVVLVKVVEEEPCQALINYILIFFINSTANFTLRL